MDKPIVLAVVDDHPVVIEGVKKILTNSFHDIELHEFHTGNDFLNHIASTKIVFDVILLDITLPDINGIELCRKIKSLHPDTYVLGFSNHNDRGLVMQLLSNGASGYLLKNASATEITDCINEVLRGQIAFSKEIKLIISKPSTSALRSIPPLTKREQQILKMIVDGHTSAEISDELRLSPFTIETHRRNLMQKFEAKNVATLIKIASQLKFV